MAKLDENPVQALRSDHTRLIQLLYRLDSEIKTCRARAPSTGATANIIDALDYIQGYPEQWHHPLEDLAFSRLVEYDPSCEEIVDALTREHAVLEARTRALHNGFEQCLNRGEAPGAHLLKATYDYLKLQLDHQKRENDLIFPRLQSHLTESDWRELTDHLEAGPQQAVQHRHYQSVFHRLVREPRRILC